MDVNKLLNPKVIFITIYFLAFLTYIIYGLQPAEAADAYTVDNSLAIPNIGLISDVTSLELSNGELLTPDTIVGSYSKTNTTLLIGHSSGVFNNLDQVKIGDEISYSDKKYTVTKITYAAKEAIDMNKLLAPSDQESIVLMTCAGKMLENNDATHRLIIFASI